jgi:hypothetical protein
MKSLKSNPLIDAALRKIAERSTVQFDNGTHGATIKAYLWNVEEMRTKEYNDLMKVIVQKKFSGQDYSAELAKIEELPSSKAMMVFRLVNPMLVRGTKITVHEGKNISPEIRNCSEIYIPQEIVDMDLIAYENVEGETAIDMAGQEVQVVELNLRRCLIDVKEGMRDKYNIMKWLRAPRAYVTDIPFRTSQVLSKVTSKEDYQRYKAFNMMGDEDMQAAI